MHGCLLFVAFLTIHYPQKYKYPLNKITHCQVQRCPNEVDFFFSRFHPIPLANRAMPSPPPPPPNLPPPPPTLLNIPPPPTTTNHSRQANQPAEPDVPATGPPNSLLVSLLIYNGWPFADHWEYFIATPYTPSGPSGDNNDDVVGVVIQAAGDVRAGFWLEAKRGWSLGLGLGDRDGKGSRVSWRRVPLGWVGGEWFEPVGRVFSCHHGGDGDDDGDEEGGRSVVVEKVARCEFERVLFRVPAPRKTLRAVGEKEGEEVCLSFMVYDGLRC